MIYGQVKIKFKDGANETFDCADTPTINGEWTTLFPLKDPLSRHHIRSEKIEELDYRTPTRRNDPHNPRRRESPRRNSALPMQAFQLLPLG
jgi:hypothetical protein